MSLARRAAFGALCALAATTAAPGTRAQVRVDHAWTVEGLVIDRDARSAATRWDYARAPALRDAERALQTGEAALRALRSGEADAHGRGGSSEPPAASNATLLRQAQASFVWALERAPGLLPAVVGLAQAREGLGNYAGAIALLEQARDLAAERPELPDVLFRLGVAYTRLERYAEARAAYERYIALPMPPRARGVGLCNLAETYVSLLDLDRAVSAYQACTAILPDYPGSWWGLASACDRDGREPEAARAAQDALNRDPELAGIMGPDVFYVPAYDVHYYLALAMEARDQPALALVAWRRYLAEGGAQGPFARRAQAHVTRLAALATPQPAPQSPARR